MYKCVTNVSYHDVKWTFQHISYTKQSIFCPLFLQYPSIEQSQRYFLSIHKKSQNSPLKLGIDFLWANEITNVVFKTPDNSPGPKTILDAQYSPIAVKFLLILKAKF